MLLSLFDYQFPMLPWFFREETGWVWDHFEATPPISTYLVAFTICDFEHIQSTNSTHGPVYRVWAPKDDISKANYALEVAQEILPFLEQYFDIKYPLPKLDLIAIPSFGMDAMENWGLVHFRWIFSGNVLL